MPLVSILLPCYNAEKYLKYALESILNQEYKNLQILCINDGSTDATLSILKAYQTNDNRIQIIHQEKNIGLIDSLNNSFSFVTGDYFARMDADDYCPPDRIKKQVDFLCKNNKYDLISSGYNYFYKDEIKRRYCPPIGFHPKALKFIAIFSTPLTHASILGKTSLIKSGIYKYNKNFPHAEDFELFSRLSWQDVALSNINESLYWVRINSDSVSVLYNDVQLQTNLKIIRRNINEFLNIKEEPDETILKIMLNRMDSGVNIQQIRSAFLVFDTYFKMAGVELKFSKEEKKEVQNYLLLQTLNIILQSNKRWFAAYGFRGIPNFVKSLTLIKIGHFALFLRKIRA